MSSRRRVAALFACALILAACSGDAGITTSTGSQSAPAATTGTTQGSIEPSADGSTTDAPSDTTAATTAPDTGGPTEATITTPDSDPALVATINELIGVTEEVRGLRFLRSPLVAIVTEDELATRVAALIEEELEPDETARDDALYEALGIIDDGTDLGTLFVDLYSEQVAGYYDGDTEELVVPASDGNLTALQKLTMVHELTHSLTDQHFGFNDLSNDLYDNDRFDEALALSALLEGDATWTELLYFQRVMSTDDQRQVFEEALEIDSSTLDQTPSFIVDSLIWPYDLEGGAGFVSELWSSSGDFSAVDDAYRRPPTTTEQVMEPDLYAEGEPPVDVDLLDTPVAGYEVGEEATWGAQAYDALFDQSLPSATAGSAAEGWGGDTYRVMWDGEHVVFINLFVGDTERDAEEMYEAWTGLRDEQIPGDRSVFVGWAGDQVLVIVADEPSARDAALGPYRSTFAD